MCAIFRPFQIKIFAASRTMSEKKKTFVESRRGKKRESAPPCDALESINRYQNGAKNLSAARTSKNRGRLKSHKETEEEGGGGKRGIEFWWPVQNGGSRIFLHPPRIYKMGKRGLSRTSFFSPPPPPRSFSRFFSSPSLPPFRFSNAEERRMAREGVGRWLGNEESGIPPGEGEELMKERDLRIPCK